MRFPGAPSPPPQLPLQPLPVITGMSVSLQASRSFTCASILCPYPCRIAQNSKPLRWPCYVHMPCLLISELSIHSLSCMACRPAHSPTLAMVPACSCAVVMIMASNIALPVPSSPSFQLFRLRALSAIDEMEHA